jgi:hypothetical protein
MLVNHVQPLWLLVTIIAATIGGSSGVGAGQRAHDEFAVNLVDDRL